MGQFAKEGDFAEGGGGNSFIFYLKADSFEGDYFVCLEVACFVDDSVGSFAQVGPWLFNFLIAVDFVMKNANSLEEPETIYPDKRIDAVGSNIIGQTQERKGHPNQNCDCRYFRQTFTLPVRDGIQKCQ
jgi:hypothetical protein